MALIVREKQVRTLLSMRDTLTVLEDAFHAQLQGLVKNQPRTRLAFANGVLTVLAAAAPTFGVVGFKTYTAFREGVRYVVMLFSANNGELLAIIEADHLGAMRTGGTSAVATKYLARANARNVGLIGAGQQAVTQLMGVCAVRPITSVNVYSRRQPERELFCREMARLLNIEVISVADVHDAVEDADILITATTARDPVIHGEWLKPGCHINAIGSNWIQRREIDFSTLHRSTLIVTDSLEQAYKEAGDFVIPANEGLFQWERVHELYEIMSDEGPQREASDEITLYKGLGIALEDVATAAHVYYLATKQGLGEEIDLLS
ncbi:MAG: ornithine cyclodeaminase family protein [Ktedonobacteraceae bacterium]